MVPNPLMLGHGSHRILELSTTFNMPQVSDVCQGSNRIVGLELRKYGNPVSRLLSEPVICTIQTAGSKKTDMLQYHLRSVNLGEAESVASQRLSRTCLKGRPIGKSRGWQTLTPCL